MDLDQILYSQSDNQQGNHLENGYQNGNSHNQRIISKADIFNNLNTQISDHHDTECFQADIVSRLTGEDKVSQQQIAQIVQIAIQPYLEKIRQLEEIQQQKENQIIALFYTVKKMDEIIKKIEVEQTKSLASTAKTSGSKIGYIKLFIYSQTRKGPAGVSAGGSTSNRSMSTTRSQANHSSFSQSAAINTSQGLQKKASVPSLLDSKRSGNSLSKSTLHEPTSSRGDRAQRGDRSERGESLRQSKIATPSSKGRESGNTQKPVRIEKSKFESENDQSKQKIPVQVSNQNTNEQQNAQINVQNIQGQQLQQESSSIYNAQKTNTLQFLNDYVGDTHLLDNISSKNFGFDKEEQNNKQFVHSNNQSHENSLLV